MAASVHSIQVERLKTHDTSGSIGRRLRRPHLARHPGGSLLRCRQRRRAQNFRRLRLFSASDALDCEQNNHFSSPPTFNARNMDCRLPRPKHEPGSDTTNRDFPCATLVQLERGPEETSRVSQTYGYGTAILNSTQPYSSNVRG